MNFGQNISHDIVKFVKDKGFEVFRQNGAYFINSDNQRLSPGKSIDGLFLESVDLHRDVFNLHYRTFKSDDKTEIYFLGNSPSKEDYNAAVISLNHRWKDFSDEIVEGTASLYSVLMLQYEPVSE